MIEPKFTDCQENAITYCFPSCDLSSGVPQNFYICCYFICSVLIAMLIKITKMLY